MTEFSIKTVGRRQEGKRPTLREVDGFLKMSAALMKTKLLVPRGVYRFHKFEEAQEWMQIETTRTAKRHIQGRQQ